MKQVTMAHRMQMSSPHPKRPHPPRRCDTVVFTRITCYIACATGVQPLCNLCKHSLSRSCTHLHTGCISYLRRTLRGNGGTRSRTSVQRRARSSAFRPVVVYDGACWKDQMVATDSPSAAKANLKKATRKPKKGQELVRIPPQWEDDEEVAADVMWSVCVVPGKTSFTNEDDAVQALKKMNKGHEDKGVDKKDNAEVAVANEDNDKVAEATEDKEEETVLDAEAKGGGDEPDGDGIAVSCGAGVGVMEPNGDGDCDLQTMDEGDSPTKADEEMLCTDAEEGMKEEDEPMQEGEQGEAKPTEDVNDRPATQVTQVWPWRKRGRAMRHPRRTRQTRRVWTQRKSYGARHLRND